MLKEFIQQYSLVEQESYNTVVARGSMLDRVYSIRYRSYDDQGYIDKNNAQKFIDEYDDMSNCTSYLLCQGSRAVASIRACVYDPTNNIPVPCMEVFREELAQNIGLDNPFIESNKFVVDPKFQKRGGKKARFLLFSVIVKEAFEHDACNIVIAVRPEHINFYKMFSFKTISKIKAYPLLNFETVLMVCTDLEWVNKVLLSDAK